MARQFNLESVCFSVRSVSFERCFWIHTSLIFIRNGMVMRTDWEIKVKSQQNDIDKYEKYVTGMGDALFHVPLNITRESTVVQIDPYFTFQLVKVWLNFNILLLNSSTKHGCGVYILPVICLVCLLLVRKEELSTHFWSKLNVFQLEEYFKSLFHKRRLSWQCSWKRCTPHYTIKAPQVGKKWSILCNTISIYQE